MPLSDRRQFLKRASLVSLGSMFLPVRTYSRSRESRVTILFTNDLHSRVESRHREARDHPSEGGFEQLAAWINRIRAEGGETLLLDAGDVVDVRSVWVERWQGEVEFRWIHELGYDAVAIGDQELGLGIDELERIGKRWDPPWVASNLRVEGTGLEGIVEPYRIVEKGGIRIGVFALSSPFTTEHDSLREIGLAYGEPLPWARQMVSFLRENRGCEYCICLSHLGFSNKSGVDDQAVAQAAPGLDLIIGGHSHTRLERPHRIKHTDGTETWIVQTGFGGVRLGRVDLCIGEDQRVISCVHP